MRRITLGLGTAIALLAAAPAGHAQSPADLSPRTPKLVNGNALEDVDKKLPFSQRQVSRQSHRPPDEIPVTRPNLSATPPLTLDVAPIPLPDPRPRVMFSKEFPGLKFEREEEYGFKFNEQRFNERGD